MENKKLNQHKDILIVALSIVVLDIILKPYFFLVYGEAQNGYIIFDLSIMLLAIFFGKKTARLVGFPIWKVCYDDNTKIKHLLTTAFIGSIMVVANIYIWNSYSGNQIEWASFNNVYEPLLISIRAALTEELLYRLLIFSLIVWIAGKITKSDNVSLIVGMLISSVIFGLNHQGFYLAFVYGILLCYIYRRNGLLAAIIIHFLSDAIPFMMIYLKALN